MGKVKSEKKYNWKARRVVQTVVDNSTTSKIKLDINAVPKGSYDKCNELVIPSAKRKTKKKKETVTTTKLLSKKHRKHLEKIVEQKKKKENRASLLEALAEVQTTEDVLKQLTSISAMQTKGLKKHFNEVDHGERNVSARSVEKRPQKLNIIAGSAKRRRMLALETDINAKKVVKDPNIVGFESSSDSESDDSEEDEEATPPPDMEKIEVCEKSEMGKDSIVKTDQEEKQAGAILEEVHNEDIVIEAVTASTKKKSVDEKKSVSSKPAVFVPVLRSAEIQAARMKLPILAEEQVVMETINENSVVLIAGETGSGKTTQVPQFLYEAGYASDGQLIGVTEPRRVAAISMATRVAQEMNLTSREVSYLIRFEGNVTDDTKIKFMTDGVLLKEIQTDFLLSKYSVVILDEAHERGVYTDILVGLLSRIVPLRLKRGRPLKLVIMSATLRLEDFIDNPRLFKQPPPVVQVESRQFPVTIHFNKRTASDYLSEAYKKVCKIHTGLPEGGVLVFLTGQQEVNTLVRRLRRSFPLGNRKRNKNSVTEEEEEEDGLRCALKSGRKSRRRKDSEVILPDIDLDSYSMVPHDDTEIDLLDDEEDMLGEEDEETVVTKGQPMWVLPLYSLLPSSAQAKVFCAPPEGCRLCVVATNVAETSLTIPGVKYVVDCGRAKTRLFDATTGVSTYRVTWCSQAAANQRAGRAGRTGPGHCYRLFSSAVFLDNLPAFSEPEVQRRPVDDLVLQMKAMNIVKVVNFPFPTAPDRVQLLSAETRLRQLGALSDPDPRDGLSRITPLGLAMSAFPVSPRYARMLALSCERRLLAYTVCVVAALSVQELLIEGNQWAAARRRWAATGEAQKLGDPMVLLRAVGAAEYAGSKGQLEQFCTDNGIRYKAIVEVRKLRLQLTSELNMNLPALELCVDPRLRPPSELEARQLRQIVLAGSVGHVARRVPPEEVKQAEDQARWKHAYRCGELEDPVFLHRSSVLRRSPPDWLVYQEVFEAGDRLTMRCATAIEPDWLPTFARDACNLSAPLDDPSPRYDASADKVKCHVTGSFGIGAWLLPRVEIDYPAGIDRYKWFARALLEGSVCPALLKYTPALLSTPATMVKTWAKLQPRTTVLLKALMKGGVDSRQKLLDMWRTDKTYLQYEYQQWLPESAHNELALAWPPSNMSP